jgi:hypothetical protein
MTLQDFTRIFGGVSLYIETIYFSTVGKNPIRPFLGCTHFSFLLLQFKKIYIVKYSFCNGYSTGNNPLRTTRHARFRPRNRRLSWGHIWGDKQMRLAFLLFKNNALA